MYLPFVFANVILSRVGNFLDKNGDGCTTYNLHLTYEITSQKIQKLDFLCNTLDTLETFSTSGVFV